METQRDKLTHVLVVDDEPRLRQLLRQYLSAQGFLVTVAEDAADAKRKLQWLQFDAMVLDVMMPGETGLAWLTREGAANLPPTLFLTAMGEADTRIAGLESGAGDYLVKPFEPRELVLRLRNLLQRQPSPVPAKEGASVRFGEYRFEADAGRLFKRDEPVYLTTAEVQCLRLLARHAGQPVARETLAEEVGASGKNSERSVDVQINRLRKKIEPQPGRPIYIQTIRHAGYQLHAD